MLIAAVCIPACYHPAFEDACHVSCNNGNCPSGLTCGPDLLCHAGTSPCSDAQGPSGDGDATGDGDRCLGTGSVFEDCDVAMTSEILDVTTTVTLDTSSQCTKISHNVCVFEYGAITIHATGTLRLIGTLPVVLVSTSSIT